MLQQHVLWEVPREEAYLSRQGRDELRNVLGLLLLGTFEHCGSGKAKAALDVGRCGGQSGRRGEGIVEVLNSY